VIVQFKEKVDMEMMKGLGNADSIDSLPAQESASGTFKIQTSLPELVRKQILELALQHNLNIVSLQSESHSLEDVFRSLTQSNEKPL
jgi:ABC-2 type transport system ATP-binding protein